MDKVTHDQGLVMPSSFIKALATAVEKGYVINDSLSLSDNYGEALEYLWEKRSKVMPVVNGRYDRLTKYMIWTSDGCMHELHASLPYINNRYEHIHQRADGTMYRVVSR